MPVQLSDTVTEAGDELVEEKPRTKRRTILASGLIALLAAGAAGGWWWWSQPDLSIYDAQLTSMLQEAADVQDKVDDLQDPSDLPGFATDVEQAADEVDALAVRTGAIEGDDYQTAAEAVVRAEVAYLDELHRLASLGSADVDRSEFQRIDELRRELELAIAAALDLREGLDFGEIQLSVAPLTSSLMDLAAYRQEVIKERARITQINKERAAELAEVEGFLAQFDGVVERYSTARGELSNWIDGVDAHGASFNEAYQVLYQQAERRRQLRDELAALDAPADFAPDQAALLAVMDQAVDATESASRGIEEYQFDFNWRYLSYDETPGWRTFEAETAEISDAYSSALAAYEARKQEVVERLSEKKPLPPLPE